jgi:16S rRNA C967 or C1407 C5-methylase (RsmB/RsmF family)
MNQENLQAEKGFSFSGLKDTVVNFVSSQLNRLDKAVEKQVLQSINNYLKTPEEIDADFSHQINFQGMVVAVEKNSSYTKLVEYKDGYINIHDPESITQGFMEENY